MDESKHSTNSGIVHIPFQLALIERPNKAVRNCGIKVKINVPDNSSDILRWCHVEVQCVGITELGINIKEFLRVHGSHLCQIIREMEKSEKGSHLLIKLPNTSTAGSKLIKVNVFEDGKSASNISIEEEEDLQERKSVSFSFKVYQDYQRALEDCQGIYSYMHRLKITNPEYELEFHFKIGDTNSKSDFWAGGSKSTFGSKKIATDIHHYLQSHSDSELRVKPKSGTSLMLPDVHIDKATSTQLRLSSYAFLVPPPEADGKALSQMCTDLKLFLYGPGNIPLLLPGTGHSGMTPTSFVKLSDYGLLHTGAAKSNHSTDKAEVQGDWHFKVQSTEAALTEAVEEEPADREQPALCLCVIVILDSMKADKHGQKSLDIIDGLRQCLAQVLCKVRSKIRKCTSSALNKLLHNYTKQDQKQEVYTTAISTITKSLTSVLKRSTNASFRNVCFESMKVSDSSQFRTAVFDGLWNIAEDRYGLKCPTTRPNASQMDDSSCDAFAGGKDPVTHLEPAHSKVLVEKPSKEEKPTTEKTPAASVDFFDFLTIHRSPPLPVKTDTLLTKEERATQPVSTKPKQPMNEEILTIDRDNNDKSHALKRSKSQGPQSSESFQYQRSESKEPALAAQSTHAKTEQDQDQLCSPVRKKRKVDKSNELHQVDCFDSLAFNVGLSPEMMRGHETKHPTSMKQDPAVTSQKEEEQMKPEASMTKDWFNDLMFE